MRIPSAEYFSGYSGSSAHSQESPISELYDIATITRPLSSRMPRQCGNGAALLAVAIGEAAPEGPLAGDLITVVQIVHGVKDGIGIGDFHHRPVRKHQPHAFVESIPFFGAPEIVQHQEAAAQQIIAQLLDLAIGQLPIAHFARAEPRPIVDVVAIVQIHGLFDGPHRDASQAAQRQRKMPVGARIILGPTGAAFQPRGFRAITVETSETRAGMLRIHQTGKDPFGFILPVGGISTLS